MDVPPPPPQQLEDPHAPFFFLKNVLMTLIASIIITFSKNIGKKKLPSTLDPRPSTWYPRPRHGNLDPRQKDRLFLERKTEKKPYN